MEAEAVERLRLTAGVKFWGRHQDPRCEGLDPETCRCGFADFVAKVSEIEGSTQQGEDDAGDLD